MKMLKILVIYVFLFLNCTWAAELDDMLRAVEQNDQPTVQTLLARGMDPNTSDPEGNRSEEHTSELQSH